MATITIQDPTSGSAAWISVDQGFNCFSFVAKLPDGQSVDVLSAPDDFGSGQYPATHHGNPLLFPYPNRIAGGRYRWEGRDYQIPPDRVLFDGNGNAIHGFCLDRPWRVTRQTLDSVVGTFRLSVDAPDRAEFWPTDAEISVGYQVVGSRLKSTIRVVNPTDVPLPWGFGTHAYFRVPLSGQSWPDDCSVYVPARKTWVLNECLPTGAKVDPPDQARLHESCAFQGLQVDDIYSEVSAEGGAVRCQIIDQAARLVMEQTCGEDFRELVVFTPPWSRSICMEPYTCVTNAINLQQQGVDAGLRVLGPHEEWNGWIDLEVRTIPA